MRITRRRALAAAATLFVAGPAAAQDAAVRLAEEVKPGDAFRYEIGLSVTGKLKIEENGRTTPIPLAAAARHKFVERVEMAADAGAGKVVRHYAEAMSESVAGVDRTKRTLPADRAMIVAQRTTDGTLNFAPAGPLTREELDLVAEHFDTLCLPGLLPGKDVKAGDTWVIPDAAAQPACQFHGLVKNELVGKLLDVKDGFATFAVEGKAEGIEHGAVVKVTVSAKVKFDLTAKRVTAMKWDQTDDREQGPVSPALEVKAEITVSRVPLAEEPKELAAAARAAVPADDKIPAAMTQLRYADAAGKFQFVYPRDWHVTLQDRSHLVMRLVQKGEFVAQATVTEWKKPQPGADFVAAAKEFREATAKQPGWAAERILEDGLVPTDAGRKIYRLSAAGKQDGLAVVQAFHLLAGPGGELMAITTLSRVETAEKVGTRDVQLVNAVEFPGKK